MVFGMSLATYTLIHVIISLIGIGSGLIVLFGMFGGKRLDGMTALFLATTALTSLTGLGFPFEHVTPGIILAILSLVVLAYRYSGPLLVPYGRQMAHDLRGHSRDCSLLQLFCPYRPELSEGAGVACPGAKRE